MIVWQGPSLLDGRPIVVIVTGVKKASSNTKTSDMPQVWILCADQHPVEALRSGCDSSICGDCIHRPKVTGDKALSKASRSCYVNTMSIGSIYRVYRDGRYDTVSVADAANMLEGREVRLGAYGDPAAVPLSVWDTLLAKCLSTGYTHQWRKCDPGYARYCMASCDSTIDVELSTSMGYRTFFVQDTDSMATAERKVGDIKLSWCPASKEMGKVTTCNKCMVCSGTRSGLRSNVTIILH